MKIRENIPLLHGTPKKKWHKFSKVVGEGQKSISPLMPLGLLEPGIFTDIRHCHFQMCDFRLNFQRIVLSCES